MKIILVRHAESQEDIDPNMNNADDAEIGITIKGRRQSIQLAKKLRVELEGYKTLKVFHSPSRRVRDTTYFVLSQVGNKKIDISEIECIRNLNWGETNPSNAPEISKQRYEKGVLYFQFPNGDYTPDFVNKIGNFVKNKVLTGCEKKTGNCMIIFTHGFALRVIAKFILNISDEDFKYLKNPHNCFHIVLETSGGGFSPRKPLPTVIF